MITKNIYIYAYIYKYFYRTPLKLILDIFKYKKANFTFKKYTESILTNLQ